MLAGGMFANNVSLGTSTEYYFIQDANVTANLGKTLKVGVTAHYEKYVSAQMVDFGTYNGEGDYTLNVLPGGVTMKSVGQGADIAIDYVTQAGDEDSYNGSVQLGQNNTRFIIANMEGNYWDPDGDEEYTLQGVCKYAPGDYEMVKATFAIPADFAGGDFCIYSKVSCGADEDPEINANLTDKSLYGLSAFYFTVDQAQAPADPQITFTALADNQVKVTVTAEDGATLIVNGEEVEGNPYEYTVTQANIYEAETVTVTAQAKKGDLLSNEVTDSYTFTAQEMPVAPKATMNVDVQADKVVVTFTPAEGTTITVNGEALANPYEFDRPAWDGQAFDVTFAIVASGTNMKDNEYNETVTVNPQAKPDQTVAPTIEVTNDADNYYVTATGEGHIVLIVETNEGRASYDAEGDAEASVTLPRKDADYTATAVATAQKAGELESEMAEKTFTVLAKEVPAPAAPTFEVTSDDEYYYITFSAEDGATIEVKDAEGNVVENPVKVARPEYDEDAAPLYVSYTATATKNGKTSEVTETGDILIEQKAKPEDPQPTTCTTPDGSYAVTPGQHEVVVTIIPAADNDAVYYRIIYTDVNGVTTTGDWLQYTGDIKVTADGKYRVEFYGVNSWGQSEQGAVEFTVSPTTGLDEVAAGKTVSNVRYFNMAGQEMQEANGMSIVVTSYTDGITSAVMVMK